MKDQIITVTGKGSVRLMSDVIRIDILLTGKFMTYNEAYFRCKTEYKMLANVVMKHGLDSSIVSTVEMGITKQKGMEYNKYTNMNEEVTVGYLLNHTLRIMLPKEYGHLDAIISDISRIIEDVDVKVDYTVADPRQAKLKVLANAVEEARIKAEVMAEAAGYHLAGINNIVYSEPESSEDVLADDANHEGTNRLGVIEVQKTADSPIVMSDKVTVSWFLEG